MRLDKVLERIGAQIVKADKDGSKVILFIRVGKGELNTARWKKSVEELLLACSEQKEPTWHVDVSKAFFTQGGVVKYLWRFIFSGDARHGTEDFGRSVMRSLSVGGEVMSMPLVGQVQYEFDPAKGKMKGGHDSKRAAVARSVGLSGGNIQ